jgi:DNA polymerase-4
VVVPPRFDAYREVSDAVFGLFRDVTPLVQPLSLDEAFLDVGGAVRLFGEPPEIGHMLRCQVRDEVGLPCSVGVGPTLSTAKLLSDKAKPDGLLHLPAEAVSDYLRPLPVGNLWGAGPKTVQRLEQYGIRTVADVADADVRTLARIVGDALAGHLHRLAHGQDDRTVTPHEGAKSISASATFEEDVDDPDVLHRRLLRLAEGVARRLRRNDLAGRTITLTVRFANFDTITRSTTIPEPTDRTRDVVDLASALLDALRLERVRVRLLGVGVSNLIEGTAARQLSLDTDERWEAVDHAADEVAERFPDLRLQPAVLLDDHDDEHAAPNREDQARLGRADDTASERGDAR